MGLRGSLYYSETRRRVIYSVENTLHQDACSADGNDVGIDAVTGEVLGMGGWGAEC